MRLTKSSHKQHASTAKSTSSLPAGGLAGILVALIVVLVIIIIVGILFWRRRRNQSKEVMPVPLGVLSLRHHQDEISEPIGQAKDDDDSRPIPVEEFSEYIASNRDNDFAALKQEYKRAPNLQLPWTVARKTINKNKNRYGNIVSYDHSRVAIKPVKGEDGSDYINASFMHGYDNKPKTYIATQGPLAHTFNDFWSMIWEQKASSIVMLTNLLELGKIKCHQYWPDDSAQYADITVTNHTTEVFADYVLRTFILSKGNHPSTRRVLQFHFTVWPDKAVPQHATAVLAFRRKVRALTPKDAGPLVVHCSAGVGRTGAFIMIDAMLEQANNESCVDVFRFIKSLRNDRPNMVQTEDQYVFVYLALNEAISCGNTEIQVHNLRIATQKLSAVDQQHNATGYSLEFQKLGVVTSQEPEEDYDIGETPENTKKNRHPDIIPANRCRVILNTVDEDEGNYINAVFIDAYRDRNAFIMTQAPMENTIVDFWRMVMDYEIGTIVMLNNLQEGDEIFPQYWPQDGNEMYGQVQVQSLDSSKKVGFVSCNLQVSRKTTSRTIKHFQHVTWVDKCVPDNPQSILLLLDDVQRSQQKCANTPVLVQCSNGVGRSGTFCAIASCLERVKQEQVLDVFQTVKSIRVNRPGAVETLIQYVFCYQIIQKYLDSFNDYDNFNGR